MEREIRSLRLEQVEVRSDNGVTTLVGYAARFNVIADIYWFREMIAPGAFTETLSDGHTVKGLWNHDTNLVLASTANGSLILAEDENGLRFELTPSNTTWGRDALESVKRGDVDGVSFGFFVSKEEWDWSDVDHPLRVLKQVDLFEISPTPFPAYATTNVSARSAESVLLDAKKALDAAREKREKPTPNTGEVEIRKRRIQMKTKI